MDAKLEFEVDADGSVDMVNRGEERNGGWMTRRKGSISRRPKRIAQPPATGPRHDATTCQACAYSTLPCVVGGGLV